MYVLYRTHSLHSHYRVRHQLLLIDSLLIPVLDVGADVLELGEDLGEEGRFGVDPEHRLT